MIVTRNGAGVAYANLLFDATTGAIIETDNDFVTAVGDNFLKSDPAALITIDGKSIPPEGNKATPVAASPEGTLVVNLMASNNQLAAFIPKESAASAQY